MRKELEIISDVISPTGKLVKKDVICRKVFETDRMEVEEIVSNRGIVSKKYCTVFYNGESFRINAPYGQISSLVRPIEVRGFAAKSRRYK